MRDRTNTLRWTVTLSGCIALSLSGLADQVVYAQQANSDATPEVTKEEPESKSTQADKKGDDTASKPFTQRPDPRRPIAAAKAEPKTDRQLAQDRKARDAAKKNGELTFDDLKFEMEKDAEFEEKLITKEIKDLDKKVVKLRGFILPNSVFQQSGIKQFVLVRDNQECCFGPGAAIYDCVMIDMAPGKTTSFATRVVTVKGKLEIDTKSYKDPEGGYYAIYKMTAEEVK